MPNVPPPQWAITREKREREKRGEMRGRERERERESMPLADGMCNVRNGGH